MFVVTLQAVSQYAEKFIDYAGGVTFRLSSLGRIVSKVYEVAEGVEGTKRK